MPANLYASTGSLGPTQAPAEDPIPQGPAPLLNRAWPRRGWAAPPAFGKSVPALMMETTITITRRVRARNDIGGYKAGNATQLFQGPAHVERLEESRERSGATVEVPMGAVMFHHWEIFMPLPADPTQLPRKGDQIQFSDGYGTHDVPLMYVARPDGLNDHLELITDEFQA